MRVVSAHVPVVHKLAVFANIKSQWTQAFLYRTFEKADFSASKLLSVSASFEKNLYVSMGMS
jgi:hypothetical protein